jgi:hypothetical protein
LARGQLLPRPQTLQAFPALVPTENSISLKKE